MEQLDIDKYYGEWEVIRKANKEEIQTLGGEGSYYICKCSCGKVRAVLSYDLTRGASKSCGHNSGTLKNEQGKQYGEWYVVRRATETEKVNAGINNKKTYWLCRCSCNKEKIIEGGSLRKGMSTSCGHSTTGVRDETDNKYGEWRVIRRATEMEIPVAADKSVYWLCECSCGRIDVISGYDLRAGLSTHCGHIIGNRNRKIDSERTVEQIDLLNDTRKLKDKLMEFESEYKRKPNSYDIADILGANSTSAALALVRSRGLEELVDVGQKFRSQLEMDFARDLGLSEFDSSKYNRRVIPGGYEADIYFEELKLGLDINGNYWHSEEKKDNRYHQMKSLAAKAAKIELMQLFEYEITSLRDRKILLNMIKNKINDTSRKIYARNCELKYLSNDEYKAFSEQFHLQGYQPASTVIGLVADGIIISAMSFGVPRFSGTEQWEIIRYVTRSDVKIVGGAEKILKEFRKYHKGTIVSYCDIAKFTGKVYERLGFKMVGVTNPSYVWFKHHGGSFDVLSRYQCQKKRLVEKGWGTEEQTEADIMKSHGYLRIYDCGCYKYVL